MNRLIALAMVAVLALAGCSSGSSAKPGYGSVTALRDAAVAGGYPCPSWVQTNVVKLATGSGNCSSADVFSTYATPGELDAAVANTKKVFEKANAVLAPKKMNPHWILFGENWIITAHVTDLNKLQAKMGGTILQVS